MRRTPGRGAPKFCQQVDEVFANGDPVTGAGDVPLLFDRKPPRIDSGLNTDAFAFVCVPLRSLALIFLAADTLLKH
jgi:hypothetical protein